MSKIGLEEFSDVLAHDVCICSISSTQGNLYSMHINE